MCCSSAMSVSKIWHTSSRRHQSLSVRDSLETSQLPTIPTSPNATEPEDAFESFATGRSDAGTRSEIGTDYLHRFPAEVAHPFGHVILKTLTLLVLPHLFLAGLAQVDDRFARQVLRLDFGIAQELIHQRSLLEIQRLSPACGP